MQRSGLSKRPTTLLAHLRAQTVDRFLVVDQPPAQRPTLQLFSSLPDVLAVLDTVPQGALTSPRRQRTADFGSSSSTSGSDTETDGSTWTPSRLLWLDLQTSDAAVVASVLERFPTLHPELVSDALGGDDMDTLKTFAAEGYFFANVSCGSSGHLSLVAFEDWVITHHTAPLDCVIDAVQRIDTQWHLLRRHTASPAPEACRPRARAELTTGWLVATLLDLVVDITLPDPTAILGEVDRIDEMILLIRHDQRDLLQRIARARRVLSAQRAALFSKMRLMAELLTPALHGTCIARGSAAEKYRETLAHVHHVGDRFDAARDALTQANATFVGHIALETSQVSNAMSKQMKLLSQIATICLPLNILTGAFGMNVTVPFQTQGGGGSLVPFLVLVLTLVLWLVVCGTLLLGVRAATPAPLEDTTEVDALD